MTPQEALERINALVVEAEERQGAQIAPARIKAAELRAILREAKQYPYLDGPTLVLGPECFTGDGDEFPQDVIMWRGAAYVLAEPSS